jgi:hypothetical protein
MTHSVVHGGVDEDLCLLSLSSALDAKCARLDWGCVELDEHVNAM